jgi:hypothetical protein
MDNHLPTDQMNKERRSYVLIQIDTYGTHEQAEATMTRLESEINLQGFQSTILAKVVG